MDDKAQGGMTDRSLDEEKLFYERFWSLHRNPDLVKVFQEFGIGVFRRSSVLEGLDLFMEETGFYGKCCVEIGTCCGLTALLLSKRFEQVITIDVVDNSVKRAVWEHCGATNITGLNVRNNAEKYGIIKDATFDAAYSDGDHARDAQTDFDAVRKGGRVLMHEYWKVQPPVYDLVNSLKSSGENVRIRGKLALWTHS